MNWKTSLHEIYMLSFGQALTMDEAFRSLLEMKEDRMFSIASAHAESKRAQAKVIGAKQSLATDGTPKALRRRSEAFLLETNARFMIAQPCLDMARVELGFINRLLAYIEANDLLIWPNYLEGFQLVQEVESAYELVWSLLLEPNAAVVRNYLCHPLKNTIKAARDCVTQETMHDARTLIAESFSRELRLDPTKLTISVNSPSMFIDAELKATLPAYSASFKLGTEKLRVALDEYQNADS